jgi:hypothetical protein
VLFEVAFCCVVVEFPVAFPAGAVAGEEVEFVWVELLVVLDVVPGDVMFVELVGAGAPVALVVDEFWGGDVVLDVDVGVVVSEDVVDLADGATVTLKLPVATFPRLSEEEHGTVVEPIGNLEPDAGLQVTARDPSTRSSAFAVKTTTAPEGSEAVVEMSGGSRRVGAVVSTTVTSRVFVPVLDRLSDAVHVTLVTPTAKTLPEGGEHVTARVPSIASDALVVKVTGAPDGPVASTGDGCVVVTVGGVVSTTVTVKDPVAWLERESFAVHTTVVAPNGNALPEAGPHVGVTAPSTMSDAVAEKETIAPPGPVASAVTGAGSDRVGAVVSRTVTVNEPLAWFWRESVAVQVTVVVATGNMDPDVGLHDGVTLPSTVSEAVAVKVTAAPLAPVASTVTGAGSDSVGFVVSSTVTVKEPLAWFPLESVAMQMTVVVLIAKTDPEPGEHDGVTLPSTESLAVAV